ncbi:MAG TPA: 3'(2'),5'-bisphosphate nucleotidase CysQ [Longimicrobiales bacterium]
MNQAQGMFSPVPPAHAPAHAGRRRASTPYERELDRAIELARAAGRALLRHYGSVTAMLKVGGTPVTIADRESSRILIQGLRRAFPHDAVLSEEEDGVLGAPRALRLWVVDPLDGTKEFLAQNGEFSVMLGLAVRGRGVLGVVYAPVSDTLWAGAEGVGAFVERGGVRRVLHRPAGVAPVPLRFVVSRSHPDPLVLELAERLGGGDLVPSGSVGLKCGLVAEGKSDVYVHPVPFMKSWDLCGPEVILREAGGSVTDCLGLPLRHRRTQPEQPHGIVACGPGLAQKVMGALAPLYAERAAAAAEKDESAAAGSPGTSAPVAPVAPAAPAAAGAPSDPFSATSSAS